MWLPPGYQKGGQKLLLEISVLVLQKKLKTKADLVRWIPTVGNMAVILGSDFPPQLGGMRARDQGVRNGFKSWASLSSFLNLGKWLPVELLLLFSPCWDIRRQGNVSVKHTPQHLARGEHSVSQRWLQPCPCDSLFFSILILKSQALKWRSCVTVWFQISKCAEREPPPVPLSGGSVLRSPPWRLQSLLLICRLLAYGTCCNIGLTFQNALQWFSEAAKTRFQVTVSVWNIYHMLIKAYPPSGTGRAKGKCSPHILTFLL